MKDYPKYYFAYGSNVLGAQMARRCPSARLEQVGYLDGARLCFRGYSGGWDGSVATLALGRDKDVVPGVLYRMTTKDWKLLDAFEGYPWQYTAINRLVRLQNGAVVRARAYVLVDHNKLVADVREKYADQIIEGLVAHKLPWRHVTEAADEVFRALKEKRERVGQLSLELEKDKRFTRKGVKHGSWRASTGRAIFARR